MPGWSSGWSGVNLQKLGKVLQGKGGHFHCFKFNILQIHCQFTKRFVRLLKKFPAVENYELQNSRRHLPT